MSGDRPCPAPNCSELISPNLFACPTDWRRLPKPYREMINRAFQARNAAMSVGGEAYRAAASAHENAKTAGELWYSRNP